ncbi:Signal transduction histidine kinase [Bifidobacterium hapali]|uniref:Signal transduction histidine kinase n=1 Tax=Bifidobacterium hapali TaxID=1630172 RepID=A0A261FZC8_9BIFI|nr:hypothetical protein [Bifidobacterium hapali]OZG64497.1 Signal transduction histidine kinase [Bifidobacterium hapali]
MGKPKLSILSTLSRLLPVGQSPHCRLSRNRRDGRSTSQDEHHSNRFRSNDTNASASANQDRPLFANGRTRVLLACSCVPPVIETAYMCSNGDGNDVMILFALLSVIGCLTMALLPRVGGWLIVTLWAARCVIPSTTPLSILFCVLMAVTVMAYRSLAMSVLASVAAESATAARIWLYPWDSSVVATVCATAAFLLVALWLGSMMGWQEQREREEREHAALLRRLANQQLATQLHHSVANDLTTIMLLTQQLRSAVSSYDQSNTKLVNLIEQTTQESLRKVRTLITQLDQPSDATTQHIPCTSRPAAYIEPTVTVDNSSSSLSIRDESPNRQQTHATNTDRLDTLTANELQSATANYDERLHAHGLAGMSLVNGETACACTADRKAVLLDTLREIVGNMMKYADPAAGYCIAITLAPGLATLSASNGVRQTQEHMHENMQNSPSHASDALSGGTGLRRCRDAACTLGGEFTAEQDGESWTVLLTLPLA